MTLLWPNNIEREKVLKILKQRLALGRAVLFLSAVLVVSGCKDDRLLGLNVLPEGSLDHLQVIDTLTIRSYSYISEPQRSDDYRNFVGMLSSEEFGTSSSNWAFNLTAPSEALSAIENLEDTTGVDSVTLYLRPLNAYGDVTEQLEIEVYELSEHIYGDSSYFSNSVIETEPTPIASVTWNYESEEDFLDSIFIPGQVQPFVYKMAITLPNYIGSRLIKAAGNDYTDTESLQEYFKGFKIKVKDGYAPNGSGVLYDFITTASNSFMQINYGIEELVNDTADTIQYFLRFPINTGSARMNEQTNDPTGSLLEEYLLDESDDDDLLFIQGMSGSKVHIDVPYLNSLGENALLAVSKATLTVPIASEQPSNFDRSSKLYLLDVQYDESNNDSAETLTLDYVFSSSRHGGELDGEEYVFDVTRQIQQALLSANEGKNSNYGFRLNAQVPIINGNVRTQNIVRGSDDIVLRIYYTDISN